MSGLQRDGILQLFTYNTYSYLWYFTYQLSYPVGAERAPPFSTTPIIFNQSLPNMHMCTIHTRMSSHYAHVHINTYYNRINITTTYYEYYGTDYVQYCQLGKAPIGLFLRKILIVFLNSLTAIRFRREQKTPAPQDFYGRNSTECTVHHQCNSPQTSPPWRSRSPLLRRGIYGSARSDGGNLVGRGWARALCLGLVLNYKIMA
jgi:hypothetical protein